MKKLTLSRMWSRIVVKNDLNTVEDIKSEVGQTASHVVIEVFIGCFRSRGVFPACLGAVPINMRADRSSRDYRGAVVISGIVSKYKGRISYQDSIKI